MKTKLIVISILLAFLSSCDNSTKNTDDGDLYRGENLLPGGYLFIHQDTVNLIHNDTISVVINMKQQPFKMKGTLRIDMNGLKNSKPALKLISPNISIIENTSIHSNMSHFILDVDFFNDKDTIYELKFLVDSVWAEKSYLINYGIGLEARLLIDSIFIDEDSLYFPGELEKELPPIPIPEKRWYNCNFCCSAHPDHDLLQRFFFHQNYSYRSSALYFRRRS